MPTPSGVWTVARITAGPPKEPDTGREYESATMGKTRDGRKSSGAEDHEGTSILAPINYLTPNHTRRLGSRVP